MLRRPGDPPRRVVVPMHGTDFLLRELERLAQYPSTEELRRRLAGRRAVSEPDSTVKWVREERDTR